MLNWVLFVLFIRADDGLWTSGGDTSPQALFFLFEGSPSIARTTGFIVSYKF